VDLVLQKSGAWHAEFGVNNYHPLASGDAYYTRSGSIPGTHDIFQQAAAGDTLQWQVMHYLSDGELLLQDFTYTQKLSAHHNSNGLITVSVDAPARCVSLYQVDGSSGGDPQLNIFELEVTGDEKKGVYICGADLQWNNGSSSLPTCSQ
jgi:hypothetical protein